MKLSKKEQKVIDESLKSLIELQDDYDIEMMHSKADCILCNLLILLGLENVVTEYHKIEKWYA